MRRDRWIIISLIVLTTAVFWRVAGFDFVNYDDTDYVTRNPRVQAGLTTGGVAWAFGNIHGEATYWHPLTWMSHMLDCNLFGLKPDGPHVVNLLWHIANVVLVFLVFQRMTGATWRSAMLAALFAIHPLQVETVAWIAERKNVLSTFFWMLTLGAYTLYAEKPGRWRYAAVILLFALGLMAKPMLVTLPCVLLLLDYWPLRRFNFSPPAPEEVNPPPTPRVMPASTVRLVWEKVPLFALAILIGLLTVQAHKGLGMAGFDYGLKPGMQIDNALVSYLRYLGKIFWPADLSVLYIHPGKWPGWAPGLSLLALIVGSGLILRDWRRYPYLTVGWLWFLGTLVPVIGLIQVGVQAMANRFAYVPVIGIFLILVWGGADLFHHWKLRPATIAGLSATVLAACFVLATYHLGHWRDSLALFQYAIKVDPRNFVAHNNLAFSYLAAGQFDQALHHALEALRVRPQFPEAQYQAGLALEGKHQDNEALPHFQTAIRLDPKWALPHFGLARIMARRGEVSAAITNYQAGLRIWSADGDAHADLAQLLAGQGRTAEAIVHYRDALRLRPNSPEVLNNLAWLLATHPQPEFRDGKQAILLAERACALSDGKRAIFIGTLSAAYAEAGRYEDAVRAAQKARQVAEAAGETQIAETNAKLVELYRAGKPARDGAVISKQ